MLEGSRAFFPALVAAIDAAHREVLLETYIFDFTGSGADVAYALERAGAGAWRCVVMDGFGTPELPPFWEMRFDAARVQWALYSRTGAFGLLWPGQWRRLHRKLCVIDESVGFCGGINILDDFHDPNHGALSSPRFDFPAGGGTAGAADARDDAEPVVAHRGGGPPQAREVERRLRAVARHARTRTGAALRRCARATPMCALPCCCATTCATASPSSAPTCAPLAARAMRSSSPTPTSCPAGACGARWSAARRGVQVNLLLQGRYEYFMQYYASRPVFGALLREACTSTSTRLPARRSR